MQPDNMQPDNMQPECKRRKIQALGSDTGGTSDTDEVDTCTGCGGCLATHYPYIDFERDGLTEKQVNTALCDICMSAFNDCLHCDGLLDAVGKTRCHLHPNLPICPECVENCGGCTEPLCERHDNRHCAWCSIRLGPCCWDTERVANFHDSLFCPRCVHSHEAEIVLAYS